VLCALCLLHVCTVCAVSAVSAQHALYQLCVSHALSSVCLRALDLQHGCCVVVVHHGCPHWLTSVLNWSALISGSISICSLLCGAGYVWEELWYRRIIAFGMRLALCALALLSAWPSLRPAAFLQSLTPTSCSNFLSHSQACSLGLCRCRLCSSGVSQDFHSLQAYKRLVVMESYLLSLIVSPLGLSNCYGACTWLTGLCRCPGSSLWLMVTHMRSVFVAVTLFACVTSSRSCVLAALVCGAYMPWEDMSRWVRMSHVCAS